MVAASVRACASLFFVILITCTASGCPKLNRWAGPTQDPFFSIADPQPQETSAFHSPPEAPAPEAADQLRVIP